MRRKMLNRKPRDKEMQGRIEKSECRSFPRAVERDFGAASHVGGREGTQGARDLLHPHVGKMPHFEGGEPFAESGILYAQFH